jgi:uncharacterized protein involved in outer membrane biogenesis
MLRKIFLGIGIIIFLLIIGVVIVWFNLPNFAERILSKKFKTEVSIEDIALTTNKIEIEKISIANPDNFALPTAFSTDLIDIRAPWRTYLSHDIVIDQLSLNNVYVSLIFHSSKGTEGNWSALLDNFNSSPESKEKKGRTLLIKKFYVNNIALDLLYGNQSRNVRRINIPRLEFDNISSETGFPVDQITNIIVQQMLMEIFRLEGIQNMLQNAVKMPLQQLEKVFPPFKGLFSSGEGEVENLPAEDS